MNHAHLETTKPERTLSFPPRASVRREVPFEGILIYLRCCSRARGQVTTSREERLAQRLAAQQLHGRGSPHSGLALVLAQLSAAGMQVEVRWSYSDGQGPHQGSGQALRESGSVWGFNGGESVLKDDAG